MQPTAGLYALASLLPCALLAAWNCNEDDETTHWSADGPVGPEAEASLTQGSEIKESGLGSLYFNHHKPWLVDEETGRCPAARRFSADG